MPKTPVSEQEHLDLLNKVLKEQPDYAAGMAFVPAPAGLKGGGMSGYDTSTPYESAGAYQAAVKIVRELYELVPVPRD
jgi:hypothetical protein